MGDIPSPHKRVGCKLCWGNQSESQGVASGGTAETSIGTVQLCNAAHGAVDVIVRPEELVMIDGTDSLITRVDYFGHDTIYDYDVVWCPSPVPTRRFSCSSSRR